MKAKILLVLFGLLLVIVALRCDKKPERTIPQYLDIIFTSDMFGELDPCGCKDHAGGLARRATFINNIKSESADSGAVLLVDGGSLTNTKVNAWDTLKTELAVKILTQIGYNAVNLGITDLFLGKPFWDKNKNDMFISGNVLDSANNTHFLPSSKIVELKGLNIGIIGVMDANLSNLMPTNTGFLISDVNAVLPAEITALRPKCDLIVLLAHADIATAKQWAFSYPDVDVVIGGHDRKHLFEPEVVETKTEKGDKKNIPICFSGPQAKSPGNIRLFLNRATCKVDSFKYTLVLMDETYSKDVWIDSVLAVGKWQNYQKYKDHPRIALADTNNTYIGNATCQECHPTQYKQWSSTPHATAMETLKESNDPYNLECISCHVTGWEYETGFMGHSESPQLAGVGCEVCHGPARKHNDKPSRYRLNRIFSEESCIQCHNKEWSIDFKFDNYISKIKH
jgi:2',3'-cyclic-nucleotide 2'-phosphodiesterase (5'-nucleotidase family)